MDDNIFFLENAAEAVLGYGWTTISFLRKCGRGSTGARNGRQYLYISENVPVSSLAWG
jgi:hypothetical protein